MLPSADVQCPYCGETIAILVDASAGDQRYIEDCQVCCRPITIAVAVADDGALDIRTTAENEA